MPNSAAGGDYPLVAVLGPTAAGKSELALAIARRFAGEIVNFDSVQVYRYFDIGSAKPGAAERLAVTHHLIDAVEPDELFSAGDYALRARDALAEIRARGRLAVLAGGTGFYLRALVDGLFPGPRRDPALRARLEKSAVAKNPGHLHRLLARLDPSAAERIHANDKPKLIRAIEVCLTAREPITEQWREAGRTGLTGCEVIRVGLDPPRDALAERIRRRTEAMYERGLVEETRAILDRGIAREARAFGSLGYRQALDVINGRLSVEEAVEETALRTRQYAKRQMTWFRRELDVFWLRGFGDDPEIAAGAIRYLEDRLRNRFG